MERYKEEGSTTTPFDMMLRNSVSRYHVIGAAIKGAAKHNSQVALDMTILLGEVRHQVSKCRSILWLLDGTQMALLIFQYSREQV